LPDALDRAGRWSAAGTTDRHHTTSPAPPTCRWGSLNCSFFTAWNTSAGVSSADLIVNGNVEASATGATIVDLGNGSGAEANEGQMNIGQFTHLTANHCNLVWGGAIPWVGVWSRRVYPSEAVLAYNAPWDLVAW
jgi:hypothetical protein